MGKNFLGAINLTGFVLIGMTVVSHSIPSEGHSVPSERLPSGSSVPSERLPSGSSVPSERLPSGHSKPNYPY